MAASKVTWPEAFENVGTDAVGAWKKVSIFGLDLWMVALIAIIFFVLIVMMFSKRAPVQPAEPDKR